jgi:hypothetical protein
VIDVSEDKLRRLLKENPDENAGKMITSLVIERLLQKSNQRISFRNPIHIQTIRMQKNGELYLIYTSYSPIFINYEKSWIPDCTDDSFFFVLCTAR